MKEIKKTYSRQLPVRSFSAQFYSSPYGHDFDIGKRKPSFSFLYIVKGQVTFHTLRGTVEACAGDFMYIPYGIRYHSVWRGEEGTEHYCLHAVPRDRLYEDPYALQKIEGLSVPSSLEAMREIYEASERGEENEAAVIGAFFALWAKVLPEIKREERSRESELLVRAVQYIEAQGGRGMSVLRMAEALGVSESTLYHLFQKEMGTTPIKYHNAFRLERVIADFDSKETIEEIALRNGFESYGYFRERFKAHTGMTPKQYRMRKYGWK